MTIWHITTADGWRAARAAGRLEPAPGETFVHCASANQLPTVAARFFAGRTDLVLLGIEPRRLASEVRAGEADGDVYPHVYGPVPVDAVVSVVDDWQPVGG